MTHRKKSYIEIDGVAYKECNRCKEIKLISDFGIASKKGYVWIKGTCNKCNLGIDKEYRKGHRRKDGVSIRLARRERTLRKLYGLSMLDYEKMVDSQAGTCAICHEENKGKNLRVDHDHETGVVRGLLCDRCNKAIGQFEDNPVLLRSAIDYIILRAFPGLGGA